MLRPFSGHVLTRPLGQSDLSSHSDGCPTSKLRNTEGGDKRDGQTNRQMREDRLRKTATKTDEETGKKTENTQQCQATAAADTDMGTLTKR